MALWGNKDSKSATGTVSIASTGVVTGSSTLFTSEAKIGNVLKANGVEYQIVTITSDTAAKVIMGRNNGSGTVTTCSAQSYTLAEKPAFVAHEASNSSGFGSAGDTSFVYGVDTTEETAGGDNVVNIQIGTAGTGYLEAPAATVSAPTSLTIPTTAVNTTTDTITSAGHRLLTGTKLTYLKVGATAITGLTDNTAYYAIVTGDDTFKVASSLANAQAGTAIDLTGTGSSTQTFTGDTATVGTVTFAAGAVTAVPLSTGGSGYTTAPTITIAAPKRTIPTSGITIGTDTIAYTGHGLAAGDAVVYNNGGSTAATGLTSGTTYYVATAGRTANAFEVKAANTTGTLAATVAVSGTGGQFTCGNSTLAAGDRVTITGTLGGTATITSYATGTTYKVSAVTGTSPSVTGFTLTTEAGTALTTTAGTLTGLTYTTETVIDISGTGNNAQYFVVSGATVATATASLGSGSSVGTHITHPGWVRRTVGTGGRAGRIQYETLVAMGSISGDASDDAVLPDA
jgi:hypothetical protein